MHAALLLIDLQQDFLNKADLEPAAGEIVESASVLLQGCRAQALPIIHVWTTISAQQDNRMPHWRRDNRFLCVEGSPGHAVPSALKPIPEQEFIIHKTFYSGFENGELEPLLRKLKVDTLLVAGIYLHGCIRATVLDAYQRGYKIWVAEDATGSDESLHGAISLAYLEDRAAQFAPVETLLASLEPRSQTHLTKKVLTLPSGIAKDPLAAPEETPTWIHKSPRNLSEILWQVPIPDATMIDSLVSSSQNCSQDWQASSLSKRQALLNQLADLIAAEQDSWIRQLAIEVGKPIRQAKAEVNRAICLLRSVAEGGEEVIAVGGSRNYYRYCPVGTIALITPWNNPLAIPIGKLAPALLYGNRVIWKPAPAGSAMAMKVKELLDRLDFPPGIVTLVLGDRSTAMTLMAHPQIDAVSLSGSSLAGYAAQAICGRRRLPLQAELGGNNGAIVWSDANLEVAAQQIVDGAFSFAGQRCTANRRVIVARDCYDQFLQQLVSAMEALNWGDPLLDSTAVGPLISAKQCQRVGAIVKRAAAQSHSIYALPPLEIEPVGSYYPPTIICCDDPEQEVVQQETFGPVLVVQKAESWQEAIALNNHVKQGLVAALFSSSPERQQDFLQQAQAGVLKINVATNDVGVDLPFGGWKNSGIGPPEHGLSNRDFYTRIQTVYC